MKKLTELQRRFVNARVAGGMTNATAAAAWGSLSTLPN